MENRDISPPPPTSNVLSFYGSGISTLRLQATSVADEILSKPPSYWNSNPDATSSVLEEIEQIKSSERLLDTYKNIHFCRDE